MTAVKYKKYIHFFFLAIGHVSETLYTGLC